MKRGKGKKEKSGRVGAKGIRIGMMGLERTGIHVRGKAHKIRKRRQASGEGNENMLKGTKDKMATMRE